MEGVIIVLVFVDRILCGDPRWTRLPELSGSLWITSICARLPREKFRNVFLKSSVRYKHNLLRDTTTSKSFVVVVVAVIEDFLSNG